MTKITRARLGAVLLVTAGILTLTAQSPAPAGAEWRSYAADLASTKYSPLDQINASNVNRLQIAWRWKSNNFGPRIEGNMETTPLMTGGVLYFTAGLRRVIIAADAATGENAVDVSPRRRHACEHVPAPL